MQRNREEQRQEIRVHPSELTAARLKFPLRVCNGRLQCVHREAAALAQFLGLCRDLSRGDFVAFPNIENPFDVVRRFDADISFDLDELSERVQTLFRSIGRRDIRVESLREGQSNAFLIQGGSGNRSFRMKIPVRVETGRVVVAVDEYEELR